jgi:hypothetical protein
MVMMLPDFEPVFHALVQVCLYWINAPDQFGRQHQLVRLERLERSRELSRNICNAVGIKPTTEHCAKWWQVCTSAKIIQGGAKPIEAFVPLEGMGPCEAKPITHLAKLPYLFNERDYEINAALVKEILEDDANLWMENAEVIKFGKDLVSVMDDLKHVVAQRHEHEKRRRQ